MQSWTEPKRSRLCSSFADLPSAGDNIFSAIIRTFSLLLSSTREIISPANLLQFNATIIVGVLIFLTLSEDTFNTNETNQDLQNPTDQRELNSTAGLSLEFSH